MIRTPIKQTRIQWKVTVFVPFVGSTELAATIVHIGQVNHYGPSIDGHYCL